LTQAIRYQTEHKWSAEAATFLISCCRCNKWNLFYTQVILLLHSTCAVEIQLSVNSPQSTITRDRKGRGTYY